MDNKIVRWIILLISILLFIGGTIVLFRDVIFFITKDKANGKIIDITKSVSGYKISVSYFNGYKKKKINTVVKLKSSYKDAVEKLGNDVVVYYSKMFPKHIYIEDYSMPKKGIVVFEIIFLVFMYLSASYGLNGVKSSPF